MVSFKNKVQLIGRAGQEVKFRALENGKCMAMLSLATDNSYKNAKGEWVSSTDWHSLIAWGRTAELLREKVEKGKQVVVHGQLRYSKYTDKEGISRRNTQILVSEFVVV